MIKPICNLCSVKQTFSYSDKGAVKICPRCSASNMIDINFQPYFNYLFQIDTFKETLIQQIRNQLFGDSIVLQYESTNLAGDVGKAINCLQASSALMLESPSKCVEPL